MKRLLTLLALVLCSCAETFVGEEATRPNNGNLPDLTATFADEEATRTYIEEGKYLRWNEDDRLTIFYGNTLNRQYKFNGATGDNSGTFSLVPDGMLGTGNAFDHIYALYPYNADARITDEGVISLALPAVQNYAENSFGRGANTMIAVTENLEDTFLAFKNACGYLKLKLYNAEGATIKSIEVKGNSGERLAGAATATIAFGEAPVLAMADDATTSVVLDCGEGVALGTTAETATEFWIVLPATTFEEGFTITATDTEGNVFKKSTTKEVVIERNAIQPMAALCVEFVIYVPKPVNNEIWYTNGSTTEPTTPYRDRVNDFDTSIISNTYNVEKECWIITFDDEVTRIGDWAFKDCSSLTSVTIPDSVTEIGDVAFSGCSSLASINIPDSVTTIGDSAFYNCSSLTSVTIPDSVTTIGDAAFARCSSLAKFNGKYASENGRCLIMDGTLNSFAPAGLTEYTIPDSVTTIGEYAFGYCSNLASITIPNSVTSIRYNAFTECSSLKSVYINDIAAWCNISFIEVYSNPLSYARSLYLNNELVTELIIPDSVTTIGFAAFENYSNLTSVTIGDGVTLIETSAFSGCSSLASVTIGESVTSIHTDAFGNCSSLTSIYCKAINPPYIDPGYSFINNHSNLKIYVYEECLDRYKKEWYGLADKIVANGNIPNGTKFSTIIYTTTDENIITPNNLIIKSNRYTEGKGVLEFYGTSIRESAFESCSSLESVIITNGVTTIGNYAFRYCFDLATLTISDSVTYIGAHAFWNCSSLTSVTIPDSVTSIEEGAFSGCESLQEFNGKFSSEDGRCLIINRGIYSVAPSGLTEYTIPDDVTWIGNFAFVGCSSLTSVTIGDSVTTIGDYAFYGCSSLTSITIPDSVTTIGYEAFRYCRSLTSVYCKATTPPYIYGDIFLATNISNIYVPMESVEAYKCSWYEYAYMIVGYDFEKGKVDTPEVTGGSYTVVLNNAWRESASVSNPDSSLYDGVYESYSNYNVNNGVATMYIDIEGYTEFSIYVRSDAESSYDYVTVSELDSTTQKMSTSGKQNSGTAISNYTKVTYTDIDGGSHRIIVTYRKDGSVNEGTDRGYIIIPKNQ